MSSWKLFGRYILILFISLTSSTIGFSQDWNGARLVIIYGGNIPFNFNSINKYTQGIEVLEGTILGISLADSGQVGHDLSGFELNMRAFNGATEIMGDAYNIDLDAIRIKAENYLGFGVGFSSTGYQDLTAGWNTICTYTDPNPLFTDLTWDNYQLGISYECGKPISGGGNRALLGEPPDYYRVEIELELVPTGLGF